MYADGVDFSMAGNKALAVQLAHGTGMTETGGLAAGAAVERRFDAASAGLESMLNPLPSAGALLLRSGGISIAYLSGGECDDISLSRPRQAVR